MNADNAKSNYGTCCLHCLVELLYSCCVVVGKLVCPSYSVMPTKSVELRANHSGQNCLGSTPMSCSDCTWSRSGDLTRCHQLYLLSRFAVSVGEFCVFLFRSTLLQL